MLYQRHPLKAYLWQDVPCYYTCTMYMPCVMCKPTLPATKEGRPAQKSQIPPPFLS